MKKYILSTCVLFLSFAISNAQTPAFPGAEGHGRYTIGGRGGKVVRVINLKDNASTESVVTGSLRWALNQSSPKTIVFDVSGTIELKQTLKTGKDNITIAGQTAPGDGICVSGYDFVINSNHIIIRFMRFRPGDTSGGEPDGLSGMDKKNIIVDHCSVSWSVDEGLSVYGMENSTVQWCLISEALRVSNHGKGTHCYGGNWGGNKASYHHNLIAHCESRTPRLGPRHTTQLVENVDIRNNVYYNWAGNGCYGGEGQKMNIVNNYYKPGPATDKASSATKYRIAKIGVRTEAYVKTYPAYAPSKHLWGKYYIDGNKVDGNEEVTADNWTKGVYAQQSNGADVDSQWTTVTKDTIKLATPLDAGVITTHTADLAYERVLEYVGCGIKRDEVDLRIIDDVRNRKASFTVSGNKAGHINTPSDTKPSTAGDDWSAWPSLVQGVALADSDNDGIPNGWLEANYPGKKATDKDEEGYTYLEVYLNSLVEDIITAQNESGSSSIALDEIEYPNINVYFALNNILKIDSSERLKKIEMYNLSGTKISVTNTNSHDAEVCVTAIPQGVYLLQIHLEDYRFPIVKKIIK